MYLCNQEYLIFYQNFDITQTMQNRMDSNEVGLDCYLHSQFLKESLRFKIASPNVKGLVALS